MKTYYTVQCDDKNRPIEIEIDKYFELKEANLLTDYVKICQDKNLQYEIYIEHFDEKTDTVEEQINVTNEFINWYNEQKN